MYEAIVIGTSAGGLHALSTILPALPKSLFLSIIVVQHLDQHSDGYLVEHLAQVCSIPVKEVEDKEPLKPGAAYIAPGGYHVLIESDRTLSLSADPRVNFCCPSIDVLFESAADVFGNALIGVVLTGANSDGSLGLKAIKAQGGCIIVQNPETAESRHMPQAVLNVTPVDHVMNLEDIAPLLVQLGASRKGEQNVANIAV